MEMFIHFQVPCDDVAGKMDHILRTLKRLQAAVSNRSAGGKTPPFASPRIFLPFQAPFLPDL